MRDFFVLVACVCGSARSVERQSDVLRGCVLRLAVYGYVREFFEVMCGCLFFCRCSGWYQCYDTHAGGFQNCLLA